MTRLESLADTLLSKLCLKGTNNVLENILANVLQDLYTKD